MVIKVRIPKKISLKKSIKGYDFVHSHPTGEYEDFTFKDYNSKNIITVLNALHLPIDGIDVARPNSYTSSTGSVTGPTDTYFHTKSYAPAAMQEINRKLRAEIKGDFVVIDQVQAANSAAFCYTLSNQDIVICLYDRGAKVITASETIVTEDLTDYIVDGMSLNCTRFISSDLKFKEQTRELIQDFIIKSRKGKARKRKVEFSRSTLLPRTSRVPFCYPVLQSTVVSSSVFNRILNKTDKYKFRGFTKLSHKAKTNNIQARMDKLYKVCLPQMEDNFNRFCGGVETWDTDGDRYRSISDVDRRTQFVNHAAGATWVAANNIAKETNYFNVYYAHNILEKYLLSLDALPIDMDSTAEVSYKDYANKILTLYMYSKFLRKSTGLDSSDITSYVGREGKVESLECISFKQLYLRIPYELHENLIKNIQPATATTAVLSSAAVKSIKTKELPLPNIVLTPEGDKLAKALLKDIGNASATKKHLNKLLKTV